MVSALVEERQSIWMKPILTQSVISTLFLTLLLIKLEIRSIILSFQHNSKIVFNPKLRQG